MTQYLLQGFIGVSEIQGQILFSALRVSEAGRYQASRLHLALSVNLARAASYHGSCLSSQRLLHPFLFFCVCGLENPTSYLEQRRPSVDVSRPDWRAWRGGGGLFWSLASGCPLNQRNAAGWVGVPRSGSTPGASSPQCQTPEAPWDLPQCWHPSLPLAQSFNKHLPTMCQTLCCYWTGWELDSGEQGGWELSAPPGHPHLSLGHQGIWEG